jgi:DNA-binding NtrC family response regulator
VARAIHAASGRAGSAFVAVDCSGLAESLIESELFGHEKGAFTGALARKAGLVEAAAGGTLFLDEVGDIPLGLQVKLLRLLETGTFRRVGGLEPQHSSFRLIAATHRDLQQRVRDETFRADLYYRLAAFPIRLPPLRERREDIIPLANAFLKRFAAQANRVIRGFTESAVERLAAFDWPGNVRQLQNEVQRAVLLSEGEMVDATDLSVTRARTTAEGGGDTNFTLLEGVERSAIIQMLKETGGNKLETAKRLGIGRQTLYNKIKAYGIEV